jgi:hypothetical protein
LGLSGTHRFIDLLTPNNSVQNINCINNSKLNEKRLELRVPWTEKLHLLLKKINQTQKHQKTSRFVKRQPPILQAAPTSNQPTNIDHRTVPDEILAHGSKRRARQCPRVLRGALVDAGGSQSKICAERDRAKRCGLYNIYVLRTRVACATDSCWPRDSEC